MRQKVIDFNDLVRQAGESLQSQAREPNIKKYVPHEKQVKFHSSVKKRKLYLGGNRSGKTVGGVTEGIWRSLGKHPYRSELNVLGPTRGRVIGVDFTQGIDKIILPKYAQYTYPSILRGGAWETAYDRSARVLNFENGSFVEFMSYDQDLDKFAGTSRHWVHFDEEPPESIYGENLARLIDTNGDFWITMTPVDGMTWVYDDLYEPNHELPPEEAKVEIIEINTLENPYLNAQAVAEFIDNIPDKDEASTRIAGAFVQQGGRIYGNFDPTVGGPHVLKEPIDDPASVFPAKNWLWIMSLDHGLKNPTSVHWTAVNEWGFCITFDEWFKNELTPKEHARHIKQIIKKHGRFPDILVADPSIKRREATSGVSVQLQYQQEGLSFTLGNNDVESGIARVKTYFNPQLLAAGFSFVPHPLFPEANREYPALRFTPNCVNAIREHKRYRFKTYANKKLNDERNPYDVPNPKDDHSCDEIRYALMTRPDLFANNNKMDGNKLDEIMEGLKTKITLVRNNDIADPHNRIEGSDPMWNPERNSMPSGDWEFDEHLGGLY